MRFRHFVCVSMLVGCASAPKSPGHDRNLLTRDEISSVSGATNIYDVIRRLRSEYLTDRGRTSLLNQGDTRPTVFMDEQEFGPIESLRNIQPDAVQSVQFYTSSMAVAKFGSRYGAGVIQIRMRGT